MKTALRSTLLVVVGMVALAALSPVAALADGPLSVQLQLGDRCVRGHKPSDLSVKVKLLRHDGSAIETKHDDTVSLNWSVCFQHVPVAGNKLQLRNSTFERTATVPDLTLDVDRVASVVRGHAPANKTVEVTYLDCRLQLICVIHAPSFPVNVNSQGRFHKDLSPPIDIDGADEVDVLYQDAAEDAFSRATEVPYLQVTKPDRIRLSCAPRGTTTVRLLSATGAQRATESFHAAQDCRSLSGSFRKNGQAVNVHTGDRIVSDFATDARIVWPVMSVDGQGTTLVGRCLKDSPWVVFVSHGPSAAMFSGTTDAAGHFSFDTATWHFGAGDVLDLVCETGPGDRVRMVRTL